MIYYRKKFALPDIASKVPLDGGRIVPPYWREPPASPELEHAFLFDNCDAYSCRAWRFRGTAATLVRPNPPDWQRPDMPALWDFQADYCYTGILQNAVDWMIHAPRISNMRDFGIDFAQGACACNGGQVYGCGTGGIVRAADVAVNGTEFSDCPKGLVIKGNDFQGTAIYSERCEQHNILVGALAELTNTVIKAKEWPDANTDLTPTCIEFANRDGLCANWSTMIGGKIDLIHKGATGIHVNGTHMLTIDKVMINGGLDHVGFLVDAPDGAPPPDNLVANPIVCGPAVVIRALGSNCRINIRYHQTPPRMILPSYWPASSSISANGLLIAPGAT